MDYDFIDIGTGPALLFIPGSYSNHAAWKGVQNDLQGSYRLITTSLPGYGGSAEVRGETDHDISLMTDFVADVAGRVGEPVHLVGHSFGGLVTLAAAMSGKVDVLSLINFEGNPIYSQPEGREFWWKSEVFETQERFETSYAAGIIIDYWTHSGAFCGLPEHFQNYCRANVFTNILDWRSAASFSPRLNEYADITVPSTIVRGEKANPAMVEISEEISRHIPDARLQIVPESGHFLITTHPASCAEIIDDQLARL